MSPTPYSKVIQTSPLPPTCYALPRCHLHAQCYCLLHVAWFRGGYPPMSTPDRSSQALNSTPSTTFC
ncbi:hypothetical protein PISMIDRAFT_687032 [Pisolithus microcarpus 441]|uniref:Uncharacterized protein n=1 Tax=Pisolithus microcarpus 441 TaxID=765257 RepID=A0A0C9XTI3_9AGAM|nr:hypothetical protein PISMIDRAFT_687032 [Pisolithus microcarpus 441]